MYCWTLLSRDISATPYLMGVTDDLAKARKLCEPHLESRRAFLGYIQAVRPAMTAHGLDSCYVPVGPAWLGRLMASDAVGWRERELLAGRGDGENPNG
jgi:hypothetical protein